MKKWIVLLLVVGLAFVGCAKKTEQSAPEEAAQEAVESAKEAVPEEAAKAEVEDPDVKNCLQLVSQAKFADALPICLAALERYPDNDRVKDAVEKAKAAVGEGVATATEAAEDAQKAAGEKAQDAMEGAPIGSLP